MVMGGKKSVRHGFWFEILGWVVGLGKRKELEQVPAAAWLAIHRRHRAQELSPVLAAPHLSSSLFGDRALRSRCDVECTGAVFRRLRWIQVGASRPTAAASNSNVVGATSS